ncbi:MAG: MotA/TolQ/ExbB proton channel family protein [Steroidobacteraceae bacterium]
MNLLGALENGLFALGQVLRLPVIVLLWVSVALAVWYAGAAFSESLARRRERRGFVLAQWLKEGAVLGAPADRVGRLPQPLRALLLDLQRERGELAAGGLENRVAEHEGRCRAGLAGPRALVKLGPSLGLLGTLIPMGSSLAALASGNLQAMAGQMVVAFTTTIVGLATGTVAYAVAAARQERANETIREQRFVAERVAAELALA